MIFCSDTFGATPASSRAFCALALAFALAFAAFAFPLAELDSTAAADLGGVLLTGGSASGVRVAGLGAVAGLEALEVAAG
eukprot:1375286-Alexandrium_andersonii.AAC.1